MSTNNNTNDDKYIYCPDYDSFFSASKQKLQKRLIEHLNIREPWIKKAVENTIEEIENLGYSTYIDEIIPDYTSSFINIEEIDKLINEWNGPIISEKYKAKFHDITDETGEIDASKFNKDAVNWLDQSSYKVDGKYFFAVHIINIKSYLHSYCQSIADISETQRTNIINYSCIYFAVQLLSTKTKFKRSKQQPLIRNKTMVNSKELHEAFKILYNNLDLVELKKIVKKNNKYKPKKVKGSKYRIDSNLFTTNLIRYCSNLLNQEKAKLDLSFECNAIINDLIPDYFQDLQRKEAAIMDVDRNTDNASSDNLNDYISPPPKPTPPPRPPLPALPSLPSLATKQDIDNNSCTDCCCCTATSNHNIPVLHHKYEYPQHPKTVYIPIPVPVVAMNENGYPYHPTNGIYNYHHPESWMYHPTGYGHEHSANYMGSAAHFRYHPYNINKPPTMIRNEYPSYPQQLPQHNIPPAIPMEPAVSVSNKMAMPSPMVPMPITMPITMPMINSKFNIGADEGNYENVSISSDATSSLSYSAQSVQFPSSVESPYDDMQYYGNSNQSNYL